MFSGDVPAVGSVEYIPLTGSNFERLKAALQNIRPPRDSYLACPAYYLLTGRKGGYLLTDGEQILAVCRHPHKVDVLLVLPEIGSARDFKLTKYCLDRYSSRSFDLLLGKISDDEAIKLRAESGVIVDKVIDNTMDWAHPVHVHSTSVISRLDGAVFAKIRNKIRIARRDGASGEVCEPIAEELALLSREWAVSKEALNDDSTSYYGALSGLLQAFPKEFAAVRVVNSDSRLLGMMVWRVTHQNIANIYAHISDRSCNGVADMLIYYASQVLMEKSVEFINVGGSEDETLDNYKRKFRPILSLIQNSYKVIRA